MKKCLPRVCFSCS